MGDTLRLGPTQELTVLSSTPDALLIEASWAGDAAQPPAHLHPAQEERFEVLAGTLHAIVGGEQDVYRAGHSFTIAPGVAHQMWSPEGPARARWETRPAGRTEEWFRRLDAIWRAEPPDLAAFGPLLAEYDDVFRLA
jgi:mannose-6-phosphate isomerase-like protein (cupin superfamily)